jgi:hypothetical protein
MTQKRESSKKCNIDRVYADKAHDNRTILSS